MSNQISSVLPKFYIYKLTFKSGKTYIGQHTQKKEKDKYITSSSYYYKHLQDDPLIKREIILEVKDKKTLSIMETICILADKAERGKENVNGNRGDWIYGMQSIEWTEEARKRLSERLKGRKVSEETRKKLSERLKGRKISEETRKKLSEAARRRANKPRLGKSNSKEMIEKQKATLRDYYKNHRGHNFGKKLNLSEEQYQKLRERNLGKKASEETKRKMSEKHKGIPLGPMTESHKKRVAEASRLSFLNSEKKRNALNHKGHKHWTNGKENKFQLECPGESWYEGFSANTESHSKKVRVLETNQVFRTQRECAIALGVSSTTIKEAIKRNHTIIGKYRVELV